MTKERNGITGINRVCKSVLKLTDADFEQALRMVREQSSYVHPLKNAAANRQQDLGNHNFKVLTALRTLQDVIKSGEGI